MSEQQTERRALQEEIKRLRARVAALEQHTEEPVEGSLDLVALALANLAAGAVVASISASGEILYVNSEFTAITGYTMADVPTVSVWLAQAYPDPGYRADVSGNWSRDVSEPGRNVVYRVTCKDGLQKEILMRMALLPGARMVVSMVDMSEQQRMLRDLSESEGRFRQLASAVDQVFWVTELQPERVLYVSPAFEAIWGVSADALYENPRLWAEAIHEEDRGVVSEAFEACIHGRQARYHQTFRIVDQEGNLRWIEDQGAPVHDGSGRIYRISGIAKDITSQHLAREALRVSEERYRSLVETIPMGLVVFVDERVVFVNPATVRKVGAPDPEALLGRSIYDFIIPEDRERVQRLVALTLEEGPRTARFDCVQQTLTGATFQAEMTLTPVQWRGQPAGQVLIIDITQRKRAEQERLQLEQRMLAAQKMESLAVLAGGVAHDFNNLLVGILGNADLALSELPVESTVRGYLEGIELAARRSADLARQMLAYSGKGRFVIDRLDLRVLLEEITHLMEVSISKKAVIKYNFDDRVPPVSGDATQIRQVIMNLITNASEALGVHSGIISVSTGAMECDTAYLSETYLDIDLPPGLYTYLEVSDTGHGMDESVRQRIFDPFFTTKFTGRGLGLAAVLGIVKGHRGAIKVYSEIQRGTTFKVLFPAVADAVAGLDNPLPAQEWAADRHATILLVDDEETVRAVGAAMLRRIGYAVITAQDGRAAVATFEANRDHIDCVLLDLSMPRMDGQETFRELRRIDEHVKVILTSGYNEQDAINRFAGKKLAGFIQKPFSIRSLAEAVQVVLEGE